MKPILQDIHTRVIDTPRLQLRSPRRVLLRGPNFVATMPCRMFARTAIWLIIALASLSMAAPQELPKGEGKKLIEDRCTGCHGLKPVVSLKQSQDGWKKLVLKMVEYGAQLDDKEVDVTSEYLTKYFGPASGAKPEGPAAATPETPEAKIAKRYIEGICSSCHDAGLIRSTEATKQEWLEIVTRMNGLDAGVSQRDVDLLVDYLASNYGPKKN
jgi:cytochrome c5